VPRYMSQDLFNSLAVKLAWMSRIDSADNRTSAAAIDGALQKYRRFFTADPFEHELRHASIILQQWLCQTYPNPPEQMAWLNALRNAIEGYKPSGAAKPTRLLTSLRFTSPRRAPAGRAEQCINDVGSVPRVAHGRSHSALTAWLGAGHWRQPTLREMPRPHATPIQGESL